MSYTMDISSAFDFDWVALGCQAEYARSHSQYAMKHMSFADHACRAQSLDLLTNSNAANDAGHRQGFAKSPPSLTISNAARIPEQGHVNDTAGYCTHPDGHEYCPSHSPYKKSISSSRGFEVKRDNSDCGVYRSGASQQAGTDSNNVQMHDRQRPDVMPPALKQYIHDPQCHEKLAIGYGTRAAAANNSAGTPGLEDNSFIFRYDTGAGY